MILIDRYNINNWNDIEIDLIFKTGLTVIRGDSSVGKSVIYNMFSADAGAGNVFNFNVVHIDVGMVENNIDIESIIKKAKNSLIIIDNGDIVISDNMRGYISTDENNQYIIMSHSVMGYTFRSKYNSAKMIFKNNRLTLKY